MSKKCPKCGSCFVERRVVQNINHNPPHDITYRSESVCGACYHTFQTLMDTITTDEYTLAEKLVYLTEDAFGDVTWSSTIVPGWYVGREDCIAATVAKLKEPEG